MSQLREEKAQLQEELVALRERLAVRDSEQQATSTQLQNQVSGEGGTGLGHCPLWNKLEDVAQGTWDPPGHPHNGQMGSPSLAWEHTEAWASRPDPPCAIPRGYQGARSASP